MTTVWLSRGCYLGEKLLLTVYEDNAVKVYDANIVDKHFLRNNIKGLGTLAFYGTDMNDVRAAVQREQ